MKVKLTNIYDNDIIESLILDEEILLYRTNIYLLITSELIIHSKKKDGKHISSVFIIKFN